MTLIRQLWLAVIISAVSGFLVSLMVSIWSAQDYLIMELERKNHDVANSLALSLTHQSKDVVDIELNVAALYDTGFYQQIVVTDPFDKEIVAKIQQETVDTAPEWFRQLFPIESIPAAAQINEGWQQFGMVTIVSHTQFAYQTLWQQTQQLLLWFLIGGGIAGALGMLWLRNIGRSILLVVHQAEEIGERHFIKVDEPNTPELKALARAMNAMVDRVRQMFNDSTARLEELRRHANNDALTSLLNRESFMVHFRALLQGESAVHSGVLLVVRMISLDALNNKLGRNETDALLKALGEQCQQHIHQEEGAHAGRVKAGELALVLPGQQQPGQAAEQLQQRLNDYFTSKWPELKDIYHMGAVRFEHDKSSGEVFSAVDQALARAEQQGCNAYAVLESDQQHNAIPAEQWRSLISQAIKDSRICLQYFPVNQTDNQQPLHQEGMVRLQLEADKPLLLAGDFMPIAAHLNLTALIDFEVTSLALQQLAEQPKIEIAVNLSAKTLDNWTFRERLSRLLQQNQAQCSRLWLEVAEYGAFKHFDAFKDLCSRLQTFGCHVGIEQFGQQLAESQRLTELGLDYVKLHPSLVVDIERDMDAQKFIQRFSEIAHSIGIRVIATGLQTPQQCTILQSLSIDGLTGPAIGDPQVIIDD